MQNRSATSCQSLKKRLFKLLTVCLLVIQVPIFAQVFTPSESAKPVRKIRIALPDQQSITASSPERFQLLVNFLKEYWQIWGIDNHAAVEFVYLSTAKAEQELRANNIDVISIINLQLAPADFLYSMPFASYKQSIFRHQDKTSRQKLKIAVLDENKRALNFLPNNVERIYFEDLASLLAQHHQFDALYSVRPWLLKSALEEYGIAQQYYVNQEEVPEVTLHFATRKANRALMLELNEYIRQINPAQAKLWQDKYLNYEGSNFTLSLGKYLTNISLAEKRYLIDNNTIHFAIDALGSPPFVITRTSNYLNDRGFSIDLLKIMSERTGLVFKPVRFTDYQSVLESIDQNTAQLLPIVEISNDIYDDHLFTIPFLDAHYSGFYNPNISDFTKLSDANQQTIALVKMFPVSQEIKQAFPKAKFIEFDTIEQAISSVAIGNSTLFIGRSLLAASIVKQRGYANLTSIPLTNFRPNAKFAFAANKSHQELVSLLNKALNNVSADQFDSLYAKWSQSAFPVADVQAKVADAYRHASYVFFAILFVALILFWIYYRQLRVRKAAQQKVEQALAIAEVARKDAEKSAQAKINFLARMSHEIRTPMNGVLGMAEALSYSQLNQEQSELLETLEGSARHLMALLNDVLDFSKMDAGKMTLESVPVNLHLLAKNLLKSFHHIQVERNLDLQLNIDDQITHSYFTDPTRLNQVLNNLISNAIKFTAKGSITLSIQRVSQRADKLDIFDTIRISVKDTGIGISPDKQKLLFSPFTQADTDITRKFGGTGLGLSICHEIVSAMGSQIQVKSAPEQGSEFYFELTLKEAEFERETEDRRKNSRAVNSPYDDRFNAVRVLVAEDNIVNVKVLTAQLARLGINADVAEDGVQALVKHEEHPYDIIISDCHMPNMDGFELAKHISSTYTAPIWLIAVTADALSGAAEKCLAAGFDDYMAKPCPQEEITDKLNHAYRALQKKKQYRSSTVESVNQNYLVFRPQDIERAYPNDFTKINVVLTEFMAKWPNEKDKLLIHLDLKDRLKLKNDVMHLTDILNVFHHEYLTQLLNDCLQELSSEQSDVHQSILKLCSNLDLLFVEIEQWLTASS
ncbi:ATP-binding protein [Thalassotalea marina]|uniref:histidine kinase n=1 Tax=Thalassotalea marina TaxID=1673741 RepID=A0A919EK78_9GAMM|nr:ATP-binding protein [Thalassotalea marina]GHF88452.1 hypothetical protein GCM10017161_15220 [Thalassotalea marina]